MFALELMIISDLFHTIISRSVDDLILVGGLVVIRTAISYFLNKEIQEVSSDLVLKGAKTLSGHGISTDPMLVGRQNSIGTTIRQ